MHFKKIYLIYLTLPIFIISISFFINYYHFYYNFPHPKEVTSKDDTFSEIRARNIIEKLSKEIGSREIGMLQNEKCKKYIIKEINEIYSKNVSLI
jgi:hypothetical protein